MKEQDLINWKAEFEKYIMKLFESAKKASAGHDNSLLYAGKFATMREVSGWIERHPIGIETFEQLTPEKKEVKSKYGLDKLEGQEVKIIATGEDDFDDMV